MSRKNDVLALQGVFTQLADTKLRATRIPLASDRAPLEHVNADSAVTFNALVSDLYKFWHEVLASDVRYLRETTASRGEIDAFSLTVRALRHAEQHAGAVSQQQIAQKWRESACGSSVPSTEAEWRCCGDKLLHAFVGAALSLLQSAIEISSNQQSSERWRTHVEYEESVDPKAVRERVSGDLGLSFNASTEGYLDRTIAAKLSRRRLTSGDDAIAVLQAITERVVLAEALPKLPCQHDVILDRLDSWGEDSIASLCLAHGLAGMSWASTEAFLSHLAAVWNVMRSDPI